MDTRFPSSQPTRQGPFAMGQWWDGTTLAPCHRPVVPRSRSCWCMHPGWPACRQDLSFLCEVSCIQLVHFLLRETKCPLSLCSQRFMAGGRGYETNEWLNDTPPLLLPLCVPERYSWSLCSLFHSDTSFKLQLEVNLTCCFSFRHNTCSFPFLLLYFGAILLLQESWLIDTPCQYSIPEESVLGQLSGGLNAVSCLCVFRFWDLPALRKLLHKAWQISF